MAQHLGGEPVTVPGHDVVETILDYARAYNFTHLIVLKSSRSRWREAILGSITQRLISRAGGLSVHVIGEMEGGARMWGRVRRERRAATGARADAPLPAQRALGWSPSRLASACCCSDFLAIANVALVFLMAVLVSAISYGLLPSLLACLASVMAYNFFFLPPLYSFTIADPENVVALVFFTAVALIASNLTARVRAQALTARQRARTTEELYQFSRKLAGAVALDDVLWATVHQVALMLRLRVVLLLPAGERLVGARRFSAGGRARRGRSRRGAMELAA